MAFFELFIQHFVCYATNRRNKMGRSNTKKNDKKATKRNFCQRLPVDLPHFVKPHFAVS